MRGLRAPNPNQAFNRARVNIPDKKQCIWQPLYDYQTKTAAATSSQRFFVDPIGTSSKTKADTNMQLSGQIPKGQAFLITSIAVELFPGVTIASTSTNDFADDVYDFYKDGYLVLEIGDKDFVTQGPLAKFPPTQRMAVDTSTGIGTENYGYAVACGKEFSVVDLLLESSQNFNVTLYEMNALPSGSAARVGVTLNGFLYRNAQ